MPVIRPRDNISAPSPRLSVSSGPVDWGLTTTSPTSPRLPPPVWNGRHCQHHQGKLWNSQSEILTNNQTGSSSSSSISDVHSCQTRPGGPLYSKMVHWKTHLQNREKVNFAPAFLNEWVVLETDTKHRVWGTLGPAASSLYPTGIEQIPAKCLKMSKIIITALQHVTTKQRPTWKCPFETLDVGKCLRLVTTDRELFWKLQPDFQISERSEVPIYNLIHLNVRTWCVIL